MFTEDVVAQGGSDIKVATVISYSKENPYEIVFHFPEMDSEDRDWIFGRDLLIEALENGTAGSGDVRINVNGSQFSMRLAAMSDRGGFVLDYSTSDIQSIVNRSLAMVPRGTESGTFDKIITDEEITGWFF